MPTFVFDANRDTSSEHSTPFISEKPVRQGEEYDVVIESVGTRGDGLTKIQNFVVFVPGTVKGEQVRIRIVKVQPKFAVGERVGPAAQPVTTAATTT